MYTLEDFRRDLILIGSRRSTNLPRWLPGIGRTLDRLEETEDSHREAIRLAVKIIDATTVIERRLPDTFLDAGARERIARVVGVEPSEVEALLSAFRVAADVARRKGLE